MSDRQQYAREYRALNEVTLLAMLQEAEHYHEDAVAAMVTELASRGIVAEPPPPESAKDKIRRADELGGQGRWQMLVGAILGCIGLLAAVGSGGVIVFTALGCGGFYVFIRGAAMKGEAERLESELHMIASGEAERAGGLLSLVEAGAGDLSLRPGDEPKAPADRTL